MVRKDIVLSSYYESDGLPQHESIEFCPCYPFPSDLQVLCNTEQLFFHGLWSRKKHLQFFDTTSEGSDISHQLGNVAQLYRIRQPPL